MKIISPSSNLLQNEGFPQLEKKRKKFWIIIRFWKAANSPLPYPNILLLAKS